MTTDTKRDWGWIALLTPSTAIERARGHLFATDAHDDGTWSGEIESFRVTAGKTPLAPGPYIARFERGREYQHVEVRFAGDRVEVRGEDELPCAVLDLAEGE